MAAASQGAHTAGGLVIGILPDATDERMSAAVDIPIVTGMGHARNVINILSSQVIIACGLGAGTLSEVAFAIKLRKPLILMQASMSLQSHLSQITTTPLPVAMTVDEAVRMTYQFLESANEL